MSPLPNTIAIFGNAPNAADVALRKVLKFKDTNGPVIIMDYIGRGAVILSEENKMGLLRRPVSWYDLADRRSSVTLFHLRHSAF